MSRAKGNIAEDKAYKYLIMHEFTVIERNFYSRFGEIDIIALKSNILHFIEVKSALEYELAVQNITPSKIRKLLKTGNVYLKKNNLDIIFIYDAIIITPSSIDMIENITF